MAYYRKLPSGRWQATVYHPSGKRVTHSDKLKRAVEEWARAKETEYKSGAAGPIGGGRVTLDAWWARWVKARRVETATAKKNDSHWRNHIAPRWGTWPIETVAASRLEVQRWITDMTKAGVGAPTVHQVYNLFAGLLADAVLERLIPGSPCQKIILPVIVKPEDRWLTRAEYARLQDALTMRTVGRRGGHHVPDPMVPVYRAYVALGCYSGLRTPGEMTGLDVRHVDFDRRMVFVNQVVTRAGLRDYPKTSGSRRWVPFPDEVAELLWPVIADKPDGAPVFQAERGGRLNEANFRNRVWRPALDAAGVDYIDPYSMRHTCASWLRQDGLPDAAIAQILGHSSTRMVGTYAHHDPLAFDRVRDAWARWRREADAHNAPATHAEDEETPSPFGLGV